MLVRTVKILTPKECQDNLKLLILQYCSNPRMTLIMQLQMSNLIIIAIVSTTATMFQCLIIQLPTKPSKNMGEVWATCLLCKEIISMALVLCKANNINKINLKYKPAIIAARNHNIIIETNVPNSYTKIKGEQAFILKQMRIEDGFKKTFIP